ncbi:thioredoxin H-type 1 [Actinidia rufa]|uniref:Thioredoxin H-type 1 n=1 Tax=Actinidia rufa TaxID=165716 RepID=A0A7J0H7S5_9ERIC|nr:thioredoxin H-type 1 [Actinidia rufa]
MGAILSSLFSAGSTADASASSSEPSSVITFHSSDLWQRHFDASKQNPKLDVAKEFGVRAMPTFVLLKQGKEVDRVVGAKKEEIEKKVKKNREKPKLAA